METKKEFFEFEKQTQKVFDEYYKKWGYEVKRIKGIANKDYDCEVKIGDRWWKVEEKYRDREIKDCLVETIQDTETMAPGWLYYTKAEYILYGGRGRIYAVDLQKLKNFIKKHGDKFNKKISTKGWGRTENIEIGWMTLTANKIAKLLV